MTITLQVAQAFDTYHVGDQIPLPDAAALALLKAFPGRYQFSSSAPGPSPGSPIVVPARPSTIVPVVGVPDPALGAAYGYALDLTSVPNVLWHWTGTVWAAILPTGGTPPPLTAPGAIAAAPTLSAATSSSLTIAWLAPTTGGAPADYLVQYRATGTTPWTTVDDASAAFGATIAGLTALTSYDIQVIATNSAGQAAASPILTVSTTAAAPVLQALGLSSLAATAGVAFSTAITGRTAGSTIVATSSDGTVLTVANGQVSGTFAAAGQPSVTLAETLAGATGSPKSTQLAVTVSAAASSGGTLDFSDPNNSALAGAL